MRVVSLCGSMGAATALRRTRLCAGLLRITSDNAAHARSSRRSAWRVRRETGLNDKRAPNFCIL